MSDSAARMQERTWDTADQAVVRNFGESTLKYVVVDVETHDWKEGEQVSRIRCIGKIVEIAWVAYDGANNLLERKSYLVKPYGYDKIAEKATEKHGISTELAQQQGTDHAFVFDQFVDLLKLIPQDGGFVIAHKMEHEDAIFLDNLVSEDQLDIWRRVPKCCTYDPSMLAEVYPLDYHAAQAFGPNLSKLYKKVTRGADQTLPARAHAAAADVAMTWIVFEHLKSVLQRREGKRWWKIMQWRGPPETSAAATQPEHEHDDDFDDYFLDDALLLQALVDADDSVRMEEEEDNRKRPAAVPADDDRKRPASPGTKKVKTAETATMTTALSFPQRKLKNPYLTSRTSKAASIVMVTPVKPHSGKPSHSSDSAGDTARRSLSSELEAEATTSRSNPDDEFADFFMEDQDLLEALHQAESSQPHRSNQDPAASSSKDRK